MRKSFLLNLILASAICFGCMGVAVYADTPTVDTVNCNDPADTCANRGGASPATCVSSPEPCVKTPGSNANACNCKRDHIDDTVCYCHSS